MTWARALRRLALAIAVTLPLLVIPHTASQVASAAVPAASQSTSALPGGWRLCVGGACPHSPVTAVSVSMRTSCAVVQRAAVWCWNGQDVYQVQVPAPVRAIAVGDVHGCAVAGKDRRVWCWGGNARGQMGVGTRSVTSPPVPSPVTNARDVSAGSATTCAIRRDSSLWCWGWGFGPNWTDQATPRRIDYVPAARRFLPTTSPSMCARTSSQVWCTAGVDSEQSNNTGSTALFTARPGVGTVSDGAMGRYRGCVLVGGQLACWEEAGLPKPVASGVVDVAVTASQVCLVQGPVVTCRGAVTSHVLRTQSSHPFARVYAGWEVVGVARDGDLWRWTPGGKAVQVTFLPPRNFSG